MVVMIDCKIVRSIWSDRESAEQAGSQLIYRGIHKYGLGNKQNHLDCLCVEPMVLL